MKEQQLPTFRCRGCPDTPHLLFPGRLTRKFPPRRVVDIVQGGLIERPVVDIDRT